MNWLRMLRSFLYSFCSLLISLRILAMAEMRYANATQETSMQIHVKASSILEVGCKF